MRQFLLLLFCFFVLPAVPTRAASTDDIWSRVGKTCATNQILQYDGVATWSCAAAGGVSYPLDLATSSNTSGNFNTNGNSTLGAGATNTYTLKGTSVVVQAQVAGLFIATATTSANPILGLDGLNRRVGINTTAPGQMLEVNAGDIQLSNAQCIRGKNTGGTSRQLVCGPWSNQNTYLGPDVLDGTTYIRNGATTAIGIFGASLMGMGNGGACDPNSENFAPTLKLCISGNRPGLQVNMDSTQTNAQPPIQLHANGVNKNSLFTVGVNGEVGVGTGTVSTAALWVVPDASKAYNMIISSQASSTYLVSVTSAGYVGIGTSNPATLLHVSSSSITLDGTGAPATGGALCLTAAGKMGKCTTQPDTNGNCTCS